MNMKMTFKAISKKLFGVKYERLLRTFFVYFILFFGLYIADFQIQIASFIFNLMVSSFSAGIMWQALSSDDNRKNMQNIFMLPFEKKSPIFSYISALGIYTLLTKTAGLFAILLAVSRWSGSEILGSILCSVNAVLVTACIYPQKNSRLVKEILWAGAILFIIFLVKQTIFFLLMIAGSCLTAILFLSNTDAYNFYSQAQTNRKIIKSPHHYYRYSVWRYLFRYLRTHPNYLVNIMFMWFVACILPVLFEQMEHRFALPIGFAILSLNTPICILLSCDPALEQAVRFMPGQQTIFFVPYCLFIFVCNIIADIIFLCSWQIQIGRITGLAILTASLFSLISAIGSVLLEWYFPIRGWKIESDLWNHPRKYVVPIILFLLAGIISIFS